MNKLMFVFISILFIASCSPKKQIGFERNAMVEYVSSDKNTITVTSKSQGDSFDKAAYHAEINALQNILFRGINNSNQENPMIADENKVNPNHLSQLYSRDYKDFMISSYLVNKYSKSGVSFVTQEVKFDLQSLRKYLEKNNMIRKFGL